MADQADLGRRAYERGAWREAFAHLRDLDDLRPDDLERLAVAAHLVGEVRESELAWERAHHAAAEHGDADRAARCAFWLAFDLLLRGESAHASGWLARAARLAVEGGAAAGYLLLPEFLAALGRGEAPAALRLAERMTTTGRQTGERDLLAFGLLCQGEALLVLGEPAEGMRRLDEAMVSVTTGEVSPIPTGVIYCAVIDACMHAQDLRRAAEWTDALAAWCSRDPSLVPYRGQCLVHRSQVLMARGAWDAARQEAERAREHLSAPRHPALGDALYQQAELCRVRGELAEAEAGYRAASRHGRDPVPGLVLLRLAQGRTETALASARRMLQQTRFDPARSSILAAGVEILVTAGAFEEAEVACIELEERAGGAGEVAVAGAATARASLLLAGDRAAEAAGCLRDAVAVWRNLDMPYAEARTRALLARAYLALGDADAAELERDAALATFEALGAATDAARLGGPHPPTPLTPREREVIRALAAGGTNREIAAALVISEHTVARHVQNIFVKLGVSSRAAATAYAYEHGLV